MRRLVLFDIDGTLLRAWGAGTRAMLRAGEQVLGARCRTAQIEFGGALDPWIFRRLAEHGDYPISVDGHVLFRRTYGDLLRAELAAAEQPCRALPGVLPLLDQVRALEGVGLGLLSGNYGETGVLKLRAAGIDPAWFEVAAWGDMAETRPALIPVALSQLPAAELTARQVVVVGDTVRDIHCAHENGSLCLAVATGGNTREQLIEAGADLVVDDLTDPAPLLQLLSLAR